MIREGIAAAPDRLDETLSSIAIDLSSKTIDMHFDHVGGAVPVESPDVFAEHLAGDNLPYKSHEHIKNAQLGWSEFYDSLTDRESFG